MVVTDFSRTTLLVAQEPVKNQKNKISFKLKTPVKFQSDIQAHSQSELDMLRFPPSLTFCSTSSGWDRIKMNFMLKTPVQFCSNLQKLYPPQRWSFITQRCHEYDFKLNFISPFIKKSYNRKELKIFPKQKHGPSLASNNFPIFNLLLQISSSMHAH